jgi:hypothetical protein
MLQTVLQLHYLLVKVDNLFFEVEGPLAEDVGASSDDGVLVVVS